VSGAAIPFPNPALASWSGGKDCGLALYDVQRSGAYCVEALVVTCTQDFDRISMHGVRNALLDAQAARLGLPVERVWISKGAGNDEYEAATLALWARRRARGVTHVLFGDLFLEDIRAYRDAMLARAGMAGVYPLWKQDTRALSERFIDLGFRAVLVCVDPRRLPPSFAGRAFDRSLLADLPASVDPCGENGEFHTCVHAGPLWRTSIALARGERVLRDERFQYVDLIETD
jgi:uncharacterized protein (TIGR00290 family)